LLQPSVVIGRHRRELRDLLAAESGHAATRASLQPDVAGLHSLTAPGQEVGKSITIHVLSIERRNALYQGLLIR
jgi:hypothetical protein